MGILRSALLNMRTEALSYNCMDKQEVNPSGVLKMEKFTEWIKELALYLGRWRQNGENKFFNSSSIEEYDIVFLKDKTWDSSYLARCEYVASFLCVASYNGKSQNTYVKTTVECIFPGANWTRKFRKIPYNSNIVEYGVSVDDLDRTRKGESSAHIWRDDLQFPNSHETTNLVSMLRFKDKMFHYYNAFWNLFLLGLDEDVYNSQLSNVIELVHYFNFDEPMLRDWCHAVEYVMNGNKLSENCDLKCETVEGRRFFLHKNE